MQTTSHDSVQITSMINIEQYQSLQIFGLDHLDHLPTTFSTFQGFRRRPQLQAAGRVARPRTSMGDTSILAQKKVKSTILVFFSIFLKGCYTQSFSPRIISFRMIKDD